MKTAIGINIAIMVILLSILIYPLKPVVIPGEREVRFRWLGVYGDYTLYVDDNKEFTSPIVVQTQMRNYPVELEPDIYFWKVSSGKMSSHVKKLIFNSDVALRVENNSLENDGNVDLNISLKTATGRAVLELPYKSKIKLIEKANITAKQK